MLKSIFHEAVDTLRAIKTAARAVENWARAAHANEIRRNPDLYGPNGTHINFEPLAHEPGPVHIPTVFVHR